jgi:hypothetical protein
MQRQYSHGQSCRKPEALHENIRFCCYDKIHHYLAQRLATLAYSAVDSGKLFKLLLCTDVKYGILLARRMKIMKV